MITSRILLCPWHALILIALPLLSTGVEAADHETLRQAFASPTTQDIDPAGFGSAAAAAAAYHDVVSSRGKAMDTWKSNHVRKPMKEDGVSFFTMDWLYTIEVPCDDDVAHSGPCIGKYAGAVQAFINVVSAELDTYAKAHGLGLGYTEFQAGVCNERDDKSAALETSETRRLEWDDVETFCWLQAGRMRLTSQANDLSPDDVAKHTKALTSILKDTIAAVSSAVDWIEAIFQATGNVGIFNMLLKMETDAVLLDGTSPALALRNAVVQHFESVYAPQYIFPLEIGDFQCNDSGGCKGHVQLELIAFDFESDSKMLDELRMAVHLFEKEHDGVKLQWLQYPMTF